MLSSVESFEREVMILTEAMTDALISQNIFTKPKVVY